MRGMDKKDPVRQIASDWLYCLGFEDADTDPFFALCLASAVQYVKNVTNQAAIPAALHQVTAFRAVGEYLNALFQSGKITQEQMGAAAEAVTKQIKQGDTAITFAVQDNQTAEQRFAKLVDSFLSAGRRQYASHRKVRW